MGSLVKTGRPCFQGDGGQRRLGAVTRHDVHKLSVGFEICCCSWQLNVQPTNAFDTRYVTQHTCMGPLWIRNCIVSVQGGVVSEPARAYTNIIRLRQRNNCHSLHTYENTFFFYTRWLLTHVQLYRDSGKSWHWGRKGVTCPPMQCDSALINRRNANPENPNPSTDNR